MNISPKGAIQNAWSAVQFFGGMFLVFAFIYWVKGCGTDTQAPMAASEIVTPPIKELPWRGEVKSLIYGKSPDEVLKALGTPVQTQESGTHKYWYYQGISRDPVTGNTDGRIQIVFDWLVVTDVNFY